ncbi:unnamed protein product [Rotaria socialis]|uniref:Kinesin motor domain-containing protein n=1 Tax=Rotaria socialis TaxID=392032 RepID=A0A819ZTE6_9BILA|nr:unnamed protein product [Rotaria socialis]
MTKCLFKALKAVDLDQHVGSFRSLGYDSAGALANFRAEHFEKLNCNEQELLRLIALLDVLKEATREGKICPHYFNSNKLIKKQQAPIKSIPIQASWGDETVQQRNFQSTIKKQSNVNPKQKRSISSVGVSGRSLSTSMAPTKPIKKYSDEVILQRPSTVLSRQNHSLLTKSNNQWYSGSKSFLNRPAIQHVKVKSYNYGIPSNRRARNSPYRATHQFTSNSHHGSIFASSSHHASDTISYAKPAEIYVYARKRPLLSTESNFQDAITVPDNKRIIIAENKANLDCTPLLKKTEFEFDQVFGSDASNKHIFEATVLPLISTTHRHNLTYICFGQTGSGKSHTIFGSRNTDGLLIHCTQLLLQETNLDNQLVCSFYEIYNNQVYDLVNAGKRLFVREDGDHHVNVIGVTEVALKNLDDLRCVIDDSLTRRHHGKSAFNSNSSRSHAVFQIILKNNYDSSENFRIIFIDLAGSERATDAQNNLRQTRREGAQINWSLLALKECIRSMDMTHSHAPFRQSKLTHILRDSLTGSKTRTCLMANVSPPDDCCQCSLNTLQYASRILDISSRHRHRSMPNASMHMSYSDDTSKQHEVIHEKPQRTFKPATASTPVHRLVSSVDQNIYKSTIHTDIESRTTKSIGIDWQVVDDDITLSGSDDNIPVKLLTSSTREFIINSNTNNHTQNNKHNFNRLQHKKFNDIDESPSSYFPQPQSNIKTSSSIKTHDIMQSYDSARLMYDDGNERQWKTVPAPTMSRLSNSAAQSSNTMRIVPVAPIELSDDNHPYNNSIGTESLGTKITTAVTHSPRYQKSTRNNGLVESLDLNKKYDSNAIITNIERTLHSDRSTTQKDQIEFLSNRDELLSIVSSRLTTGNRRTTPVTTPQTKRRNSQKESLNSPYSNKSKSSFSLTTKTRQKPRPIKSASSTSSLVKANQEKKSSIENQKSKVTSSTNCPKFHPTTRSSTNRHHQQQQQQQQRTVPLRIHHSSDSEEHEKIRDSIHRRKAYSSKNTSHSTRTEPCQTANNIQIMKKEQEQTDKYIFHEQNNFNQITSSSPLLSVPNSSPFPIPYLSPTYVPSSSSQAPLDQAKFVFHRSLEQPISPVTSTNINTPWQTSASYGSPSKEFGVRVSDQLNALRSLLETRLTHHDEIKSEKKDLNPVDSSPGIFAREFLQSLRQSSFKNNSREFTTNFLDDDQEVERNFHTDNSEKNGKLQKYDGDAVSSTTTTTTTSSNQHGYSSIHSQHFEQIVHRSLSALSDELNQAKVNLSVVSSSTSTIRSNLAAKIDTLEGRNLSSQGDDIHSHQLANRNHQAVNDAKGARENASNPTSDSERTSQVNSTLEKNPFAGTSSGGSSSNESRSRSPIVIPPFSTYDITTNTNNYHDNLLDTRKGTSFMAGSSFDALLNSLKKMREKELGFIVPTGDDKLIPVAD